ncbi:HIT family hydrolase [Nocardioides sp. Root1257]|uniref:HIT family protein n=1 Tax=unclassified Nocardioides TaxID=2615069 RepID=UPI0006F2CBFB|nr:MULTISPECIES: HIT domain-containing protein [unclassified Nocardioides]KQW43025.1 HIT family hydrolase [Nocardioides sp. Root1257]KRC41893.1 HIT family hydrolase [Nocardioides sp. Root224]
MTDPAGAQRDGFEGFDRLWTPHRMAYVAPPEPTGGGCPFCAMGEQPLEESLVIHRGETCFAVLNLHPYNPGHLMVLPHRHVAELEDLSTEEVTELMTTTQRAVQVLREVSGPHAFNVGLNLGGVAGGSLSQHLHQHVVPRWSGDANFITVLAGTKTLPQLLSDTRTLLAEAWA